MVSKSDSKLNKWHGEQVEDGGGQLAYKINQLRRQIHAERMASIKEKIEKNRNKVENDVSQILLATSRNIVVVNMLSSRIEKPLSMLSGFPSGSGEKDSFVTHEVASYITAKLPCVEKLPPYTTWIFLDKNQRMAEDQSVVGRRRIYYDQHGSEALVCSDSEEDVTEAEEEKHDYSEGEDRIIWMAFEEHGCCEDVQRVLSQQIGVAAEDAQDRYKFLKTKYAAKLGGGNEKNGDVRINGLSLNKTLSAALDSLDNLFCRRCLLFDCRLHGCSQSLVFPSEKQVSLIEQGEKKPCGDQCHLQLRPSGNTPEFESSRKGEESSLKKDDPAMSSVDEVLSEKDGTITAKDRPVHIKVLTAPVESNDESTDKDMNLRIGSGDDLGGKRKDMEQEEPTGNTESSSDFKGPLAKVQKQLASATLGAFVVDNINEVRSASLIESHERGSEGFVLCEDDSGTRDQKISREMEVLIDSSQLETSTSATEEEITGHQVEEPVLTMVKAHNAVVQVPRSAGDLDWKPLEKELYLKGIEIFGRNSCLIARNMLSGMKSCMEVSSFMLDGGVSSVHGSIAATKSDDSGKSYLDRTKDQESVPRTRLLRRKGRARKLKYSWKSAGHPSMWKRIADGKNMSCKQYTPCGCPSMCGKDCPCLQSETCCEKYCGCSKSCKNRFRGCHCAKSRCRSRQCPCFAAGRECDPDVCRNCWVSCGDGSIGEPPRRGEGQCGNMRLLLRQQQRILLAKSDVAGWGAFLKNSVNKNDYLGEYTGELISHREADKRGKIYDRANSSFLFDLNDQGGFICKDVITDNNYVLDAYRKGDKLKFANHSSNPNCYAKVMLVAGDHRVGIFAKDCIEASEELFYDYRYGPDQAPAWARTPDGSRRDDSLLNQGRAKKHQSH